MRTLIIIYKVEGWCMRTLQKRGMVQKEGIIKGRDDAGGHYKGDKEDSIKGGGGVRIV